jgi:hypothetical protein
MVGLIIKRIAHLMFFITPIRYCFLYFSDKTFFPALAYGGFTARVKQSFKARYCAFTTEPVLFDVSIRAGVRSMKM